MGCNHCGKPTKIFASSGRPKLFCGAVCAGRFKSATISATRRSVRVDDWAQCKTCKNRFMVEHGSQVYCSDKCRQRYRRKEKRVAECDLCLNKFESSKPNATYCSVVCRNKASWIRNCAAKTTHICAVCSAPYRARSSDRTPTCGRSCSKRYPSLFKPPAAPPAPFSSVHFKACPECKRSFVARSSCTKLCSDRCRNDQMLRRLREKYVGAQERAADCGYCGDSFRTTLTRSKYCSNRCSRRSKPKSDRKRARLAGVAYEPIDRGIVFVRDGWRCQICGCRTPAKLRGTMHDKAPTLDHRVPVSRGGAHTYENVQCACRRCNSLKSDRVVIGQLPLFARPGSYRVGAT